MELIPFPKTGPQAFIPSELHMPREIPRDQVTLELLQQILSEAGFECTHEGEAIYLLRSGCGLRLRLEPEYSFVRINALYTLNPSLTPESIYALLARLNEDYTFLKLTHYRWDDGDLALWANHMVHFPFGLNLPNLLFSVRKVNETMVYLYNDSLKGSPFIPPREPEVEDDEDDSAQSTLSLVSDT